MTDEEPEEKELKKRTITLGGKKIQITSGELRRLAGLKPNEHLIMEDGVVREQEELKKLCETIGKNYFKKKQEELLLSDLDIESITHEKMRLHGGFIARQNINPNPTFKKYMGICRVIAINEYHKEVKKLAQKKKKQDIVDLMDEKIE